MYNIVGFQTNLKFGEQKRVFSMIPGLEHAEFVRYGVIHRTVDIIRRSSAITGSEKDLFRVYEGCMPIEILASRGKDNMRFGPLKPVGLTDPRTGRRPYAVIQLRRENQEGTMYNIVGFQTNLKFGEQKRVFSMIPGLEHAEFVRYVVMHRNSFLDSPRLLI